jgi:beta-glucosidase
MFSEPSGDAVDHYHRYREDIALIAGLGFTSYRFSIEWARIEPEEGHFSQAELDHYRRMLEACHEHGLTPVVTFHHFTSPRWLLAVGGWEGERTPELFARYCDRVMAHLGDLIGVACTLNEPNLPWLLESFGIGGVAPENRGSVPVWAAAAERLGVDASTVAPFQFCSTEAAKNLQTRCAATSTNASSRHPAETTSWGSRPMAARFTARTGTPPLPKAWRPTRWARRSTRRPSR